MENNLRNTIDLVLGKIQQGKEKKKGRKLFLGTTIKNDHLGNGKGFGKKKSSKVGRGDWGGKLFDV